jgi:hypothetical protein
MLIMRCDRCGVESKSKQSFNEVHLIGSGLYHICVGCSPGLVSYIKGQHLEEEEVPNGDDAG